jgi:hypothetical protein
MPNWDTATYNAFLARSSTAKPIPDNNGIVMTLLSVSTDEQKLNKTERAYLAHLRSIGYDWIGIQCITLKLGDDCRYTPDLWTIESQDSNMPMARGRLVAREVKGFMRDDALVKIKVAARMFPFVVFVLVRRQKSGGWDTQIVKP